MNVLPSPDLTVRPGDVPGAYRRDGTCFYCQAPIGARHVTGQNECVIVGFRAMEAAAVATPYPVATYPWGHHALFRFPNGDCGVGGWEAATVYDPGPGEEIDHGWSHGGANSGRYFSFSEAPTHWARLPEGLTL